MLQSAVNLKDTDDRAAAGGRVDHRGTGSGCTRHMIAFVATLMVYEKPTCSTCRKLRELLARHRVDFESIDYPTTGIAEDELRALLRKIGCRPHEVLRMREPLVKEMDLQHTEMPDDQLIALISANPQLLQRPIVVRGDRALLARPVERVLELL